VAPSGGFEPPHTPPEGDALSPELRGQDGPSYRYRPAALLPYDAPVSPRVLVVDDDPVIVRLLEVNFEMEGFTVLSAFDGMEGVARARADLPDIVVSDVMMPKLNGLELCVAIKTDDTTKHIPVVLLSAKAQVSDIRAGLDSGADDYVTKPFEPLDLIDRVNKLLA
jgi:DNA-binding response OmpR family regulator